MRQHEEQVPLSQHQPSQHQQEVTKVVRRGQRRSQQVQLVQQQEEEEARRVPRSRTEAGLRLSVGSLRPRRRLFHQLPSTVIATGNQQSEPSAAASQKQIAAAVRQRKSPHASRKEGKYERQAASEQNLQEAQQQSARPGSLRRPISRRPSLQVRSSHSNH